MKAILMNNITPPAIEQVASLPHQPRNMVPPGLRASAFLRALALIGLLTVGLLGRASAQTLIVAYTNLATGLIGGNANLNRTIQTTHADYNGDSLLDTRSIGNFSETSVLNPVGIAKWDQQPSTVNSIFYGGGEALYWDNTSTSGFQRFQVRNVANYPISFTTTADNYGQSNALHAAVIWLLGNFQNFDPLTQKAVLDSTSTMTMTLGFDIGVIADHRWMIRQGGQYYISAVVYNSTGTWTLTDPSTTTWALYNPVADLRFNPATATFSSMTFNDVEGVGYYCGNDDVTDQTCSEVSALTFTATIVGGFTDTAPVNTVPGAQTLYENTSLSITGVSVNAPDNNLWWTSLTVTEGTLTVSLAGGARIDSGANGSATLTLAGSQTQINAALAAITYQPNTYFNGSDTLTVVSTDSHTASTASTVAITVNWVNQAPVGTSNTVTVTQFTPSVIYADFGFTDPNDNPPNNFLAVEITTLPALGTLSLSGTPVVAGQFVPLTDFEYGYVTYLTTVTNADSFTFQVQDDGGTANGGVDTDPNPKTLTLIVTPTPVNHAPQGANNTVATTENTPYSFAATDFGFTDPNDNPPNNFLAVKITTLPALGTLDLLGAPVKAGDFVVVADFPYLTFTPALNAVGSPYTHFTFQVQDDGGTAYGGVDTDPNPKTLTINVVAVNHPPVNTVPGPQTVAENATLLLSGVSVNDVDGNLSTTALSVNNGTLTVSVAGGATISAGANGSASLTLAGPQTQINAALATLTYLGNTNYSGPDTLTVLSTDSVGATDTDTVAINVTFVAQPPVITVPGPQTTTENLGTPVYGVSVNDPQNALSTTKLTATNATLTVSMAGGGSISAGANGSATLTLAGTQTQINAALATLSYQPNNFFNGSDTLTLLATDTYSAAATNTVAITVIPVPTVFAWDSTGTGSLQEGPGTWSQSAVNWSYGGSDYAWPVTTGDDTATFGGGSAGTAGTVFVGTVAANTLMFYPPFAGNYTLSGGTITLGEPYPLTTAPTIFAEANATINSVLAGTNGLTITPGPGILTLAGTNTYTGATKLTAGTLRADWNVGVSTNGNLNIGAAVLEVSRSFSAAAGTGAGQVQMTAVGAGFSAYGTSNVTVSVSGTVYLPNAKAGATLTLTTASANQDLTFDALLSNNNIRSYIQVASPTHSAKLTKQFTTGGSNVVIGKYGPGNLVILGGWVDSGSGHPYIYDGTLTVSNCTFSAPSTEPIVIGSYSATLGPTGGVFVVQNGATVGAKALELATGSPVTGTAYLNGGVTTVQQVYKSTSTGAAMLYFNGGTLQAASAASASTFVTGLNAVYIQSGGAILNDGGFTGITIVSALQQDPNSTGGGLTKQGTGSVILANVNTYTGPTHVQAGTLACNVWGALPGGAVDISTGAKLALNYYGTEQVSQLTFNGGAAQPNGTYGATGSGATTIDNTHFSGTGTVTVGPLAPVPVPTLPSAGFTVSGGVPSLAFPTVEGYQYRIVYSTNVATPLAAWLPVIEAPNFPAPNGWSAISSGVNMTNTDVTATNSPSRFYRLEATSP